MCIRIPGILPDDREKTRDSIKDLMCLSPCFRNCRGHEAKKVSFSFTTNQMWRISCFEYSGIFCYKIASEALMMSQNWTSEVANADIHMEKLFHYYRNQ